MSSFVTCQMANPPAVPADEIQRNAAARAVWPRASLTSATARIVPGFAGWKVTLALPSAPLRALSVWRSVSFGTLW